MKLGTIVRNRKVNDWGVGVVVEVDAKYCAVRFEVAGERLLLLTMASSLLEEVPLATIAADSPLLDPTRWSALKLPLDKRRAPAASRGKTPCTDCGKTLRRSLRSKDGALKSCPNCSGDNGNHVFYPYPDAFGMSEARATDDAPDGAQSYCFSCRGRGDHRIAPLRCGQVTK